MKYSALLWLFLITLFAFGCAEQRDNSAESSPATLTATPTAAPTLTPVPTVSPTPTTSPPPQPSLTPTLLPTLTATPIVWELPSTEGYDAEAEYALREISAETLLRLYYGLVTHNHEYNSDGMFTEDQSLEAAFQLVGHELARYDSAELLGAAQLVTQLIAENETFSFDATRQQLVGAALVNTLNQLSLDLSKPRQIGDFFVTPLAFDLNHDGNEDWLLSVKAPTPDEPQIEFTLPVTLDSNGQFIILPHLLELFYLQLSLQTDTLDHTRDFTGDTLSDLLVIEDRSYGGRESITVRIFSWHDDMLTALSYSDTSSSLTYLEIEDKSNFELTDIDNDNVAEVNVTRASMLQTGPYGLHWEECPTAPFVFEWQDANVIISRPPISTTISASCQANALLFASPQPLPDQKTAQSIVDQIDFETLGWGHFWYSLVHIRLAASQFAAGEHAAIDQTLAPIFQPIEGYDVAQQFQQAWQQSNQQFLPFCRLLYREYPQLFSPFIGYGIEISDRIDAVGYRPYPMSVPETICPANMLTYQLLESLAIPTAQVPEAALAQAGIETFFGRYIDLNGDGVDEWLAVVNAGSNDWVYWGLEEDGWQLHRLTTLAGRGSHSAEISSFETILRDVNDDGSPDLINLRTILEPTYSGDSTRPIQMVTGYDLVNDKVIVNNEIPFDLSESFTIDTINAVTVRAIRDNNRWAPYGPDLFQITIADETWAVYIHMRRFADRLLEGDVPANVRADMLSLLDQIDAAAAGASLVDAELTYLIGYTFELEGNSAEALTHYRHLIETYPDSPWAWLAHAKLIK